jgi:hypothetical protein
MRSRNQSPRTVRIVSGALAFVWLGASFLAIVLAVSASSWLSAGIAIFAFWYGLLWVRVARYGRQLTFRDALMPWRPGHRPDA